MFLHIIVVIILWINTINYNIVLTQLKGYTKIFDSSAVTKFGGKKK